MRAVGWLALPLMVVLIACGGPPEPTVIEDDTPRQGGRIVIGSISDVDNWNPYLSRQNFATGLLRRIYLGLAHERGDGQLAPESFTPELAERWSFSEDRLTLTFELCDCSWSDGTPISAEDVRFTWQAQTSADVPWGNVATKDKVTDVEVLDERRVRFHFDQQYPFQLADAIEGPILPRHVFGEVPFERWATHDWSSVRIASGPFLLERHRAGDEIVLVRNPGYSGDGPHVDQIVARIVPDIGNLLTQLRSGTIDFVDGVTPRDAEPLLDDQRISLVPYDYPGYDYIGWNGGRPPLDDPDLRRALTLAIDRDGLVEDLLYGYGNVSRGPVLSFTWGADLDLRAWPHDPDEARRLLTQHGYATLARDGQMTPGRPLEIELVTNAGNRLRSDMLIKIQEQLSRVGVKAQVRSLEMRALRQKAASGDYDGYLAGWSFSIKDLKTVFGTDAPMNMVSYASKEVDRRFASLYTAAEWQAMKPDLNAIQRRIHEDQPYTFLYEKKRLVAHGPRLGGVRIDVPSDPLAHLERFWIRSGA